MTKITSLIFLIFLICPGMAQDFYQFFRKTGRASKNEVAPREPQAPQSPRPPAPRVKYSSSLADGSPLTLNDLEGWGWTYPPDLRKISTISTPPPKSWRIFRYPQKGDRKVQRTPTSWHSVQGNSRKKQLMAKTSHSIIKVGARKPETSKTLLSNSKQRVKYSVTPRSSPRILKQTAKTIEPQGSWYAKVAGLAKDFFQVSSKLTIY